MNIKNAGRVTSSNFTLIWKQLLYILSVGLLMVLLLYFASKPIVNLLASTGWLLRVEEVVMQAFTSSGSLFKSLKTIFVDFTTVVFENFSVIWGNYVFSLILIVFVPTLVYNVSVYSIGEVLNSKLNCGVKRSYTVVIITTLKRSIIYCLYMFLFALIQAVIITLILLLFLVFSKTWLGFAFSIPFVVLALIIVFAFKFALFMWVVPYSVVNQTSITKAINNGVKSIWPKLGKYFLFVCLLFLIEFGATMLVSVFTLGAGLLVAFAFLPVFNTAICFVSFYNEHKMRYYINENTIVNYD